jgi:hypothetical protein
MKGFRYYILFPLSWVYPDATKISFRQHERNVVAPHLLTGAAAEGRILCHDALTHAPGQPIAGEEAIERACGLGLALMIDQLLEVEVVADVALGGHRNGGMLKVIGERQELRTIAASDEPGLSSGLNLA